METINLEMSEGQIETVITEVLQEIKATVINNEFNYDRDGALRRTRVTCIGYTVSGSIVTLKFEWQEWLASDPVKSWPPAPPYQGKIEK